MMETGGAHAVLAAGRAPRWCWTSARVSRTVGPRHRHPARFLCGATAVFRRGQPRRGHPSAGRGSAHTQRHVLVHLARLGAANRGAAATRLTEPVSGTRRAPRYRSTPRKELCTVHSTMPHDVYQGVVAGGAPGRTSARTPARQGRGPADPARATTTTAAWEYGSDGAAAPPRPAPACRAGSANPVGGDLEWGDAGPWHGSRPRRGRALGRTGNAARCARRWVATNCSQPCRRTS